MNIYIAFDIIDHFSKWMSSYLLKNKSADLVLAKIKSFIRSNGTCNIFQTDNGKEFNNKILKIYLENDNIKFLRSSPYHPQSNGCCEAVNKKIKNFGRILPKKKCEKCEKCEKFKISLKWIKLKKLKLKN